MIQISTGNLVYGLPTLENVFCFICFNLHGFAGFGSAYGTAKSGVGIAAMGVMRPELVMKSIVPVVMAGILGIYGLIIAVIISTGSRFLVAGKFVCVVINMLLNVNDFSYRVMILH